MNRFAKDLLAGKWVEILRTGKYNKTTFTDQDLNDIADNYDTNFRSAPLVIGHPSMLGVEGEREAHGEIYSLRVVNGSLQARFKNLSEKVKDGLQSGKWINRSIEAMKFSGNSGSDKQWYLTALALLGGSQPAVPAMLKADADKITINCINDNPNQPLKQKEHHKMDDAEIKRLEKIEADLAAQAGESKDLKAGIEKLTGLVTQLSTDIGELKLLKADNEALKASTAALVDAEVQLAVDKATAGIPKALCPDEKKTFLLSLYKTDRKMFDIEAGIMASAREKFSYLTTEVVKENESDSAEEIKVDYVKGKTSLESKRSRRMMEILAESKKDGIKMSEDDALIKAYQEVTE